MSRPPVAIPASKIRQFLHEADALREDGARFLTPHQLAQISASLAMRLRLVAVRTEARG